MPVALDGLINLVYGLFDFLLENTTDIPAAAQRRPMQTTVAGGSQVG